ncbi:MAG TPA: hypothetical protein EYO17_15715 [Dehalococcoidia bacterium]|nr:hypothetical protein [Chloroflexota bacterium]HIB13340.1 hypothetical protein [Dehalococcoidia bacterium]
MAESKRASRLHRGAPLHFGVEDLLAFQMHRGGDPGFVDRVMMYWRRGEMCQSLKKPDCWARRTIPLASYMVFQDRDNFTL